MTRQEILDLEADGFAAHVDAVIKAALEEEAIRKREIRASNTSSGTDLKVKDVLLKAATVSPATLAARLGIGETTLRDRYETADTGRTVGRAITLARLERAANLLEHRKATTLIRDIALETGWSDPRAFAKAFRELLGIDPSKYQSRCQQEDGAHDAMKVPLAIQLNGYGTAQASTSIPNHVSGRDDEAEPVGETPPLASSS